MMKVGVVDLVASLPEPPRLKLVEVGARALGAESAYDALVARDLAEVVAFEPDPVACERLRGFHPRGWTVVSSGLGDGRRHPFHLCRSPFCSSIYPPDMQLAGLFTGIAEYHQPIGQTEIGTRRLDDIDEAAGAHWLAIDTQGAELLILEHARHLLRSVLMAKIEVQFTPLYHGAPSFGEIDRFMSEQGFMLHCFASRGSRTFAPMVLNGDINAGVQQLLWADAVYLRDVRGLESLPADALLRLALIADELVGSFDLAHMALMHADRQRHTTLAVTLRERLTRRPAA